MRRPALPAGQLGDVGILLLRQHRRSGRVGVVEAGEAELGRGPQHPLFADARQVDPDQRQVEHRLGDEVPVADGVEAVVERTREAEIGGGAGRVDRQRRTRQRTRSERRHVEPPQRVEQPVDVTTERPPVREQVVGEQHRLRPLQVGVAGEVHTLGLERPCEQGLLEAEEAHGDGHQLTFAPQSQIGGHLVVAAAGGVQLPAGRPGEFGDAALDGGVDVLVGLRRRRTRSVPSRRRPRRVPRARCRARRWTAGRHGRGRARGPASRRCRRAT